MRLYLHAFWWDDILFWFRNEWQRDGAGCVSPEEMNHFDRAGEPIRNLLNVVFIQRYYIAAFCIPHRQNEVPKFLVIHKL